MIFFLVVLTTVAIRGSVPLGVWSAVIIASEGSIVHSVSTRRKEITAKKKLSRGQAEGGVQVIATSQIGASVANNQGGCVQAGFVPMNAPIASTQANFAPLSPFTAAGQASFVPYGPFMAGSQAGFVPFNASMPGYQCGPVPMNVSLGHHQGGSNLMNASMANNQAGCVQLGSSMLDNQAAPPTYDTWLCKTAEAGTPQLRTTATIRSSVTFMRKREVEITGILLITHMIAYVPTFTIYFSFLDFFK